MRYGIYRNNEGYSDPTAGAAMRNILREQRKRTAKEVSVLHGKERRRYNRRLKHQREAQQRQLAECDKEVSGNDG